MRLISFILVFLLTISLCTSLFAAEKKQAIVRGDIVSHNDFPSIVAINSGSFCTGVLAQNNLVITAKHCIKDKKNISIIYGVNKISQSTKDNIFKGINVKLHPDLDLAIILTNYAVGDCAAINPRRVNIGEMVIIAGYGRTSYDEENSGTLRAAETKVNNVTSTGITTKENYPAICFGDSGGPLYKDGFITGIHYGSIDCNNGYYTPSSAFVTWVQQYYMQMLFEENILFNNEDIDLTSGYCKYSEAEYLYPQEGCSCYIGKNKTNIFIPLILFLTIVFIRKIR